MNSNDFTRPDKLLLKSLRALTGLSTDLFANEKAAAKAKAELIYIGEEKTTEVSSQWHRYNQTECAVEEEMENFQFLRKLEPTTNHWVNLHGVHDVELIREISEAVDLDRMTVRQVLDTTQRPRVQDFDHYLFFNTRSILKKALGDITIEQISFVLGPNYILSFQEERGDHFDGIRHKLSEGIGFLRKRGSDYLLSQLIDSILDNYFESIDNINKEISVIESNVLSNPDKSALLLLETQKRSAQLIKKSLNPLKEGLQSVNNGHSPLIGKRNLKYFKDLLNSVMAALEEVDSTLKTLEGLTNIYFASLSQKMNETMKVLTTVATIFIPLTFIAGIYGMNFTYMPELQYRYGYYAIWGVMLLIGLIMLIYFKRKKWI
ncbi:magnesium/cobalt transporter CorA [Fulvivirga sp. M361]|uniref:magnesium/cobalt transporter CorA n=1 Tax=Fulvivirga sp. M361 TaxID=2594266 RepID=UPI00117A359A|nr:magnesium/cobalt transporter CorA [Fulvivirga sp. M361]TRX60482.1 magnesium/cobalt transporter CorA [Fulvivirga sp. M361]